MSDAPSTTRRALAAGLRSVGPIMLGVVPFGLVAGAAVSEAGLDAVHNAGLSMGIFAGASQLAALDALERDAPVAIAVVTALVINLRMMMYSASLAPFLAAEPFARRAPGAYLLTDQAYAVSVVKFSTEPAYEPRLPFYVGAGLGLWVTWQLSTTVGVVVGASIPDGAQIEFTIPLMFLALAVPTVRDRPSLVAAVAGGGTAVVLATLPLNLGMLLGAATGIASGAMVDARAARRDAAARR